MSKLIAGTCFVSVDGERLLLKGSMECTASNYTREAILANGKPCGHKETAVAPSITGQFVVDENFPIAKLQSSVDMTIVAEFANGKTFTLGGAYVTDEIKIAGDDSDTTISFSGDTGEWS